MRARRRTYPIKGVSCKECVSAIERELSALPGVREVSVDLERGSVTVAYDLPEASSRQIEEVLEAIGYPVAATRWKRLRLGWIHYTERNTADNLRATPTDCCADPKKTHQQRGDKSK